MTSNNTLTNSISVQGTAGSIGEVEIFGKDMNNNNIPDNLEVIRSKNWLINSALLTFYVDENVVGSDTIASPNRLFLYKLGEKFFVVGG